MTALTRPLPRQITRRMTRDAIRHDDAGFAESILRDWANPASWSSATLRSSARHLLSRGDLFLLDPRLREKLVEIAQGDI